MNVSKLIEWFYTTEEFKRLKPRSQLAYMQTLSKYVFDSVVFSNFSSPHEVYMYYKSKSLSTAALRIKILRRVYNVAIKYKVVDNNPFTNIKLDEPKPRTRLWTEEEIQKVYSSEISSARLLSILCYEFGQRPGDILKLTFEDFKGNELTITQEKTGKTLIFTIPQYIKKEIKDYRRYYTCAFDNVFINQYNYYFNVFKLQNGLHKDLQLRDLRRTAITEVIEGGGTIQEAMSISGHSSERTLQKVYIQMTAKVTLNAQNKRKRKDLTD